MFFLFNFIYKIIITIVTSICLINPHAQINCLNAIVLQKKVWQWTTIADNKFDAVFRKIYHNFNTDNFTSYYKKPDRSVWKHLSQDIQNNMQNNYKLLFL